ncbi:uncharacterized protein LOC122505288 [Leptopilina heterotoma]|uniref:uncharacterized protein LOC122505288 n=1 Tax=Leptopilina heterotoma TaxID=63436 RepID=UPI001CA988B5|nr:uncharacterized protein LOC122505288 [Leptopilina heterotoma]
MAKIVSFPAVRAKSEMAKIFAIDSQGVNTHIPTFEVTIFQVSEYFTAPKKLTGTQRKAINRRLAKAKAAKGESLLPIQEFRRLRRERDALSQKLNVIEEEPLIFPPLPKEVEINRLRDKGNDQSPHRQGVNQGTFQNQNRSVNVTETQNLASELIP